MTIRRWLAETLGLAIAFAIGGTIAVGIGLPIAWRIDRASYDWVDEEGAVYELPSYEMRPATPSDYAEALQ